MRLPALRPLVVGCLLASPLAFAAPLDEALDASTQLSQAAQSSQKRIEGLDDATQKMLDDYRYSVHQAQSLKEYNAQMRELVAAQQAELESYQQQLDTIERTEEAVTPLMRRMVQVLAEFVAADVPFLPQERADRISTLEELLPRADVGVAEKYRRILEAYQIESDYGRTLEAWRGEIETDKKQRTVDFLRVGRVMLYYQTPDGHESGWFNSKTRQWEVLDNSVRRTLRHAIGVARQEKTTTWLDLPIKTAALEAKQ
ncbi:DUF3450 domain-containing protein [Pseudomonas sp. F1_0610]|uniref:DUF3450 domain-containing protein n=1 Tax=Pseudomonas sp. F1_0610 TaxID=3114284 RepID=UPI0039C16BEC